MIRVLAVAATLLVAPAKYNEEKLPYRAAWGAYRVVVEKTVSEEFPQQRVRILDARGRVLREVRDARILDVAFVELTGGGAPELAIHAYSDGAHCCSTQLYFTRDGGLRNLLIFAGENGEINQIRDLNRDRRPELIASSDVLAYFGGLSYAASPWVPMVIGWDGRRYTDQTRRYPGLARQKAREYRSAFLAALKRRDEFAEESRRSAAAGYYGNAFATGEGSEARRWLLQHAPAATRRWLLDQERDLRAAVADGGSKLRVSQAAVLESPSIRSTAH